MDLFASQLQLYVSRALDPRALAADALITPCGGFNLLYLPTPSSPPLHFEACHGSGRSGHSDWPGLAPQGLVRGSSQSSGRCSVAASTSSRPSFSRSVIQPQFTSATFNSMAFEVKVLKSSGFLDPDVQTMLRAHKPQSAKIYHVWKSCFDWCEQCHFHPLTCSTPRILNFLQTGLDQDLTLFFP